MIRIILLSVLLITSAHAGWYRQEALAQHEVDCQKVEYEEHSYLLFYYPGVMSSLNVIHDPECPCLGKIPAPQR